MNYSNRMVGKMKLKLWVCCIIAALAAQTAQAANPGLRYINARGVIRCGTEAGNQIFAYKDENKQWQGINVELCKMLSTAIFGRSNRFQMVPLHRNQVAKALATDKIDVMIGGLPYSASNEIGTRAMPAAVWYYDRQVFVAKDAGEATSMEAFRGEKVCVINENDDLNNLMAYNNKYQLDFSVLPFPNMARAREAFLLKRCKLFTGNSMLLKDLIVNTPAGTSDVEILPETLVTRPVYIFTERENTTLRSIVKWVVNASRMAEELGITSENIGISLGVANQSARNLLGLDEKLWKKFGLEPTWLQTNLKESGNYGEIFEKTLGSQSPFKMERNENNLLQNKGLMMTDPFL